MLARWHVLRRTLKNSALPDRPGMYEPNERAAKTNTSRINEAIESQQDLMKAGNPENGGAKSILSDDIIKSALSTKNATEGVTKIIRAARKVQTSMRSQRAYVSVGPMMRSRHCLLSMTS